MTTMKITTVATKITHFCGKCGRKFQHSANYRKGLLQCLSVECGPAMPTMLVPLTPPSTGRRQLIKQTEEPLKCFKLRGLD